jgi:hypothetical protein
MSRRQCGSRNTGNQRTNAKRALSSACSKRIHGVEIGDILDQDLSQVTLIEDEYQIQTLGSDRPHPSLSDRVGARRSQRGLDLRDETVQSAIENLSVDAVTVMDEKARGLPIAAKAFADL